MTACHRPPGLLLTSSVLGSCLLNGGSQGLLPALALLRSSSFDEAPPSVLASAQASPWKMVLGKRGYYRRPCPSFVTVVGLTCSRSDSVPVTSILVSDQGRVIRRSTSLDVCSGRLRNTLGRSSASFSAGCSLTVAKRGSCTKTMGRQIASRQARRKTCPAMDREVRWERVVALRKLRWV